MGAEPLFTLVDGHFVPSEHARGPWSPDHQHGGAPAALVARALEDVAGDGFAVTRVTLDLLRPIPLAPLTVAASVTKPGRRSLGAAVVVEAAGVAVVEARAVAVRLADMPVGDGLAAVTGAGDTLTPGPEAGHHADFGVDDGLPAFHRTGMDVRFVDGGFDRPGPAKAWFRLLRPVVDDEQPTGLQRALAACDFSNGVSWVLPFEEWAYVNADLTVHLARPPRGEWMALDAVTLLSDHGMAATDSALYDEAGRLGRTAQSLVVERRPLP